MKVTVVLLAILASVLAEQQQCDFYESTAEKIGQAPRSGGEDDDESVATCTKDYQMVGCECESFPNRDDCDGARIHEDSTGTYCIAYNMFGGKGVVARPRCQKLMVTCSTTVTDMPSIRCPENYKLTGCTMHSSLRQNLWQDPANPGGKHPVGKRGGGGPCDVGKVDVVFVMDSSGSMGYSGWVAAKEFANRIVDAVPVDVGKAHFAFVQFSTFLGTVFNLDAYTNAAGLKAAISAVSGPGGLTFTYKGLDKANEILFDPATGARASAEKVVVVLTDGRSFFAHKTMDSAATLRANGVKILAIGAGSGIDVAELEGIAGDPSQVLQTTDVDFVHQDDFIHDQIVEHITCTGLCHTSPGCSKCKVQARCVRVESVLPQPLP